LEPELKIQNNVPLAPFTTLGVGGAARYFVRAESEDVVRAAIEYADSNEFPLFVLGGGSNVLIADQGFDGLVLQIAIGGINEISHDGSKVILDVGAGEDWDQFVAFCVDRGMAGVECLSGIPGFVGGTPVQNVGAYGQEVSEIISEVRCFDRAKGISVTLSNADCDFSYRKSTFNSISLDRYVVLSVRFSLDASGSPRIAYRDLIEYFRGRTPTLADVRAAVIAIRKAKSMVIDANDPNSRSAGSFFKNPLVSRDRFAEIERIYPQIPHFDAGEEVKIPAAWLIENAGFKKGFELGPAGISTNHTLALINRGDASANDILVLKDMIRDAVAEKFDIILVPEPVFIGF
jgi:UDP-N-acetylmuramate dehydrogenase